MQKLTVVVFSLLTLSLAAVAETQPMPMPETGPQGCPVLAHALFDCPAGPGYLRITVVWPNGERDSRTVFTGSRKDCLAQAASLRRTRSLLGAPMLAAVCSGKPYYQHRWQLSPYQQIVTLPNVYYETKDECLADAAQINSSPR